jgi:hypothetical protein
MSWLPNKLAAIIANPIKGLTAIITAPITVSVSLTTQAMLQELQEGWITYEEFNAFQDYVLNYAKDN